MELPAGVVSDVSDGTAVLLLGAGASFEAKNRGGQRSPSGAKLAEMIAIKFLGGEFKDYPLNVVAEYAINERDLVSVQEYIREIFEDFEPTPSHKKPPQQNLWVRFGSGSCPRLCKRASFATFAVRKPYDFLVTNFTLLFRPSTAPDEIAPRARNQFKISG